MVLHDDIQGISNGNATPLVTIPAQLMAGISSDDQLSSIHEESQLQEPLISALHSTHSVTWKQVQNATASDDNMLLLLSTIEDGIPELKNQLPPGIREYHHIRQHLYSSDGVIIYKDRIVIPPSLRPPCLSALYMLLTKAHQP